MRADAIGLFPQKVTKCRLLFFEKIRFEDFCKTGRNGNSGRWDSSRNYILSGGCAEGAECRWHSFSTDRSGDKPIIGSRVKRLAQ